MYFTNNLQILFLLLFLTFPLNVKLALILQMKKIYPLYVVFE